MHRLVYITHSPQPLQIGLSDAEKLWLDTHSLDDLKLEFKRECIKPGGGGSSDFRGVSITKSGKYRAQLQSTVAGRRVNVMNQQYDDETEAARAYDRAALQHYGRCTVARVLASMHDELRLLHYVNMNPPRSHTFRNTLTNFRYTEEELVDIAPGSKQNAASGTAAAPSAAGAS